MKRVQLIGLLLASWTAVSFAAAVSSNLEPRFATIGDRLRLEVRVDGSGHSPVHFSIPQDGDFVLLDVDSSGFARDHMLRFDFALYDTGQFVFPEVSLVVGEGASAETLLTSSYIVQIRSVLSGADTAIAANKGNWEHQFRLLDEIREQARWVVPALLLIAAAVGIWWWRKRRRLSAEDPTIPEVVLPPHELAIQELIALKDKKYPECGLLKEFYSEFSEIVRRYIERRYVFPALEMTTYELEYKFDAPDYPRRMGESTKSFRPSGV